MFKGKLSFVIMLMVLVLFLFVIVSCSTNLGSSSSSSSSSSSFSSSSSNNSSENPSIFTTNWLSLACYTNNVLAVDKIYVYTNNDIVITNKGVYSFNSNGFSIKEYSNNVYLATYSRTDYIFTESNFISTNDGEYYNGTNYYGCLYYDISIVGNYLYLRRNCFIGTNSLGQKITNSSDIGYYDYFIMY